MSDFNNEEDGVNRFNTVNSHSNLYEDELNIYYQRKEYNSYSSTDESTQSSSFHDDISSIGSINNDKSDKFKRKKLNILNPRYSPNDNLNNNERERHSLIEKDLAKEVHGMHGFVFFIYYTLYIANSHIYKCKMIIYVQ